MDPTHTLHRRRTPALKKALEWVRRGCVCGVAALAAAGASAAEVRGTVRLGLEGAGPSGLGALVVYLEPLTPNGAPRAAEMPAAPGAAEIVQWNAEFVPSFLVVQAGQRVEMPNRDAFLHNVFSYSTARSFDLGLYPEGDSRSVQFPEPGVVRIYCSIHESMRGVILVTPSPWHARVLASGEYRIRDVPPGRYRLHTFSEYLPDAVRGLTLRASEEAVVDIVIADAAMAPAGEAR